MELPMSLRDRLEALRAGMAGDAPLQAAARDLIARIVEAGALDQALDVGEPFPDFLLPDAEGRLVARDGLLAEGPFVLAFLRGGWCPFCEMAFAALVAAAPEVKARGARLLVAMPETGGRAQDLKRAKAAGAPVEVLIDVDHGLAAACGVLCRIPDSYMTVLGGFGVDICERQGNTLRMLPVPATFVVGANGLVRWRHLDADFTRRAEPADILAALEGASARSAAP
jgi:peroxiredoxin